MSFCTLSASKILAMPVSASPALASLLPAIPLMAACIAAVCANPRTSALRRKLAVETGSRAYVDADAAGCVAGLILYIAGTEFATSREAVFAVSDGGLRAGDHAALEVGIVRDSDIEALISGSQSALSLYAGVVAVCVTFADAEAAAHLAVTSRDTATDVLLFAVEAAGVLETFDMQVVAHVRRDLRCADHRAFERGVAA